MSDAQLLIGGAWVDGADGGYDVVNPATEEVVGVAPEDVSPAPLAPPGYPGPPAPPPM